MGWFLRFREKFRKGAFADSLTKRAQKILWNHNDDIVLGSTNNGTLRLSEDETGLRFENDLPESEWGNNAYQAIKRGDVDGVSFGFKMTGEEWEDGDPDNIVRTITKADIFEVSPTPFPAYPQSEVQARSIEKALEEYRATRQPVSEPGPGAKPEADPLAEQREHIRETRRKILKSIEEEK